MHSAMEMEIENERKGEREERERERERHIGEYIRRDVPFRSLPVLGITIGVTSGKPRGKTVKVVVCRERARFHPRRGI